MNQQLPRIAGLTGAGWQQIWQVWQLLDEDDAVVQRWLQQRSDCVRDQNCNLQHSASVMSEVVLKTCKVKKEVKAAPAANL
jgi:hypothetical protein